MPTDTDSDLLGNDELMHFAIEAAPNGMVIVDFTERQRSQEMVHPAVEAAPNGMVMTDKNGTITLVNSMIETLFGYGREELIGANVDILVPERFRAHHPEVRQACTSQPVSRAMGQGRDLYALNRQGEEFPVETGLNPLHTATGVMILASVVDITERKHQEESLRSALLAKETLLAEVHHRVKNTLQIIHSLIGMQMNQVAGEQARTALMDSQNRVKTISLIHPVLCQSQDFVQIDTGDFIASLTQNLVQFCGVDRSRIDLQLDVDPLFLSMNHSLPLGLVVNELVSNALKHAFPEDTSGTLTVALKVVDNSRAVLTITDTGIGLPPGDNPGEGETLGLRLMEALASQLEAKLKVNARNPTRFELRFDPQPAESDQVSG